MLRFLINPHSRSGKGKKIWESLQAALPEDRPCTTVFTQYPGHGIRLAGALTEHPEDPSLVLAVMGGDGSLNEALNGMHLENRPLLAFLPTGSGNDFAKGMGLASDPEQELNRILHSPAVRQIDYGSACYGGPDACTNRRFLVSCGMGYDAAVCRNINQSRLKKVCNTLHLGKLAYFLIGVKQILLCRRVDAVLSRDGQPPLHLKNLAFLSCHNLPCEGGGYRFAPGAAPDDGWLDLCVVTARSRLRFALILIAAFAGSRHTRFRGVYTFRCRKASLRLSKPLPLHTDGEVPGDFSGMEVTCHPQGLSVLL